MKGVETQVTNKYDTLLQLQFFNPLLSTSAGTAILADETSFLIDQRLMSAVRAYLSLGLSAIGYILLQSTLHTVFPCIDALRLQL
jgi:hypothetical protein